jgi:hypothetical protein
MTARVLRPIALLIAIAAVVDPAITTNRTSRPDIAIVAADTERDAVLAERVGRELSRSFNVIPAAFAGAAASVVVGTHLPARYSDLAAPVFAIMPEAANGTVAITQVSAPPTSPLDARIVVRAATRAIGARGRTLEITLSAGDLVIDRVTHTVGSDDDVHDILLEYIPAAVGATSLRVTAAFANGVTPRDSASVETVVDVRERRWAVLFYDPRPSWLSTFVRRSLERDPRFVVTSRTITSRGISTDVGRPPALENLAEVANHDAVVIGAPEGLAERDVAALDSYMRRRGGSVVLLYDQRPAGGAHNRLAQVRDWTGAASSAGLVVRNLSADSSTVTTSEVAWPADLPAGARVIARGQSASGAAATESLRPVIWQYAAGAGRVVVSGALDAWRFRDRESSDFDDFWRAIIADVASASPPPLELAVEMPVVAPGEMIDVTVSVRDAVLAGVTAGRAVRTTATAFLELQGDSAFAPLQVPLSPDAAVGTLSGPVRAPDQPGIHRLVATADGNSADIPVLVTSQPKRVHRDEREMLAAWSGSTAGSALQASQLDELRPLLLQAAHTQSRRERWYPMRSAWWILPFAAALAGEWWIRRRRGLA